MVKVCEQWFPKGSFPGQKSDGFYMDSQLKTQLDYLIKNVTNDWDFTIIIGGEGEVRVGKSVLAMQISCYWSYEIERLYGIHLPFDCENNFVFDGKNLISKGNNLGTKHKYSALIFDEAGADLEGSKALMAQTRAVKDYLRECGQYNMLTCLVLPEFFDLPKGIALNRSIFLINVYYLSDEEGNFKRGYFKFYSRPNKKWLYLNGKRDLDYSAGKYDFYGNFLEMYPIDEEEYRKKKTEALRKREYQSTDKRILQRNFAWRLLHNEFGVSQHELSRRYEEIGIHLTQSTISDALASIQERIKKPRHQKGDSRHPNPPEIEKPLEVTH